MVAMNPKAMKAVNIHNTLLNPVWQNIMYQVNNIQVIAKTWNQAMNWPTNVVLKWSENLDTQNGTNFTNTGRNTVSSWTVSGWEDFSWEHEGGGVGPEVEEELGNGINDDE